jgi:hypothetical protein
MLGRIRSLFTRQQPQQEQALPNYALLYFDHLCGTYQSLPADENTAKYKDVLDKLISKRTNKDSNKDPLSWHDLYTFDLILTKLQSDEGLLRLVWNLRYRYRDVAGLREYDAYMASKPPELTPGVEVILNRPNTFTICYDAHS